MMAMNLEQQKGIIVLSNSAVSVDQPSILALKHLMKE